MLIVGCTRLSIDIEGRPCTEDGQCLAGYACDTATSTCQAVAEGCEPERCDGLDNDCDGGVDEDLPRALLYPDEDNDGFGRSGATPSSGCVGLPLTATNQDDCDDLDPDFHPGAPDTVGDGEDQSCDLVDGTDGDGDGLASLSSGGTDCDDSTRDCLTDCSDADLDLVPDCNDTCVDADGDGHGSVRPGVTSSCIAADCDDTFFGCTTDCSDSDLDTIPDCGDGCVDPDGDGHGAGATGVPNTCTGTDCAEGDPDCNADCVSDADTDGEIDCQDDCVDADLDGWGRAGFPQTACANTGDDCDDSPGNASDLDFDNACDGFDNCWNLTNVDQLDSDADCPPMTPYGTDPRCGDACDGCTDSDGDGYGRLTSSVTFSCTGVDCDDDDPQRTPGLVEVCDGKDNDCDLLVDDGLFMLDADLDGVCDDMDNCRTVPNADQGDFDGDCAPPYAMDPMCGDACADFDGDMVNDDVDNCRRIANLSQGDVDTPATTLLSDDFTQADGDPIGWTELGDMTWTVVGNTLTVTNNSANNAILVRSGFVLDQPFIMKMRMKPVDDDEMGVVISYVDNQNHIRVWFDDLANNDGVLDNLYFIISTVTGGARQDIATGFNTYLPFDQTIFHNVEVRWDGARLEFWFDWDADGVLDLVANMPLATVVPGGGFGLYHTSMQNAEWDDLEITSWPAADGTGDRCDTCPMVVNPAQSDCDGDMIGDACDTQPDADGDQIADECDGCRTIADPLQPDGNLSCMPPPYMTDPTCNDACEDRDMDGAVDAVDNCPNVQNPGQADGESALTAINSLANGAPAAWSFLGPFEGAGRPLEPQVPDVMTSPGSRGSEVWGRRWRVVADPDGAYDYVADVFPDWVMIRGDLANTFSYASVWIHISSPAQYAFYWGADDFAKIWIDGIPIMEKPYSGGVILDHFWTRVSLTAGWHRVLMRVNNIGGPGGHFWRFTTTGGVIQTIATTTEPPFGDGVGNACDVCPGLWDPDQRDSDGDGVGDRCDRCAIVATGVEMDTDLDCPPAPFAGDPSCGDTCDP